MNKEQETGLRKGNCHCLNLGLSTRGNVSCDLVWRTELYLLRETIDYKHSFLVAADISQPQLTQDSSRDSFHNCNHSENKMFVVSFFFPGT